ncbi:MAG: hypothetical protein K9I99_07400 [Melioribacteraceae bacterium]|nr:hypothetical protein [Melioribacteraceae bacterium]MCF8431424.1 hypothetical protein [Melioribacteraceae bacterium]
MAHTLFNKEKNIIEFMELVPIITISLIGFSVLLIVVLISSYVAAKVRKKNAPPVEGFVPVRIEPPRRSQALITQMKNEPRRSTSKLIKESEQVSRTAPIRKTGERFTRIGTSEREPNIYDLTQYQTRSTSSHKTILVKKRIPPESGERHYTPQFDMASTVGRARMTIVNNPKLRESNQFDYYSNVDFVSNAVRKQNY